MKIEGKEYRTIWFDKKKKVVKIIDQTKLPHQFIIKELKTCVVGPCTCQSPPGCYLLHVAIACSAVLGSEHGTNFVNV